MAMPLVKSGRASASESSVAILPSSLCSRSRGLPSRFQLQLRRPGSQHGAVRITKCAEQIAQSTRCSNRRPASPPDGVIMGTRRTPKEIQMSENTLDAAPALPVPLKDSRIEHVFPTLTAAQIARIAAHGRVRPIQRGEVLVEVGDHVVPFFVVKSGEIQIVRPSGAGGKPDRRARPGPVHRGRQHDLGPPLAGARSRQPAGRSDRAGSRERAGARANRRRAQRDSDAGVHPAPRGADCARHR